MEDAAVSKSSINEKIKEYYHTIKKQQIFLKNKKSKKKKKEQWSTSI